MHNGITAGPTRALRVIAGVLAVVSVIAAMVIWVNFGTVDAPSGRGAMDPTYKELSYTGLGMALAVLLGGLLQSMLCYVVAAISDNIAAMRAETEGGSEEEDEEAGDQNY